MRWPAMLVAVMTIMIFATPAVACRSIRGPLTPHTRSPGQSVVLAHVLSAHSSADIPGSLAAEAKPDQVLIGSLSTHDLPETMRISWSPCTSYVPKVNIDDLWVLYVSRLNDGSYAATFALPVGEAKIVDLEVQREMIKLELGETD